MKFKLIEDEVAPSHAEAAGSAHSEDEIDSTEFFGLDAKTDFSSSEEEDAWEDSNENAESEVHWTVEKIEKRAATVRKPSALSKNVLKYAVSPVLTIKKPIEKVHVTEEEIYILDRTGHMHLYGGAGEEEGEKKLRKVEISRGKKEKHFKDFILLKGHTVVALTKAFHSFSIINMERGTVQEVNLYQYKDRAYTRLRNVEGGFALLACQSMLVYNCNALLVDRIEFSENIVDIAEEEDSFLVLLESALVRYCKRMKAITARSEVLISPAVLCVFRECAAVGGKGGVTIFSKSSLEAEKELANLDSVTGIEYMEDMDILVFGDKERPNGIRMFNVKDQKMITTFPPGKGLGYVRGFAAAGKSLYFGVDSRMHVLRVSE
ncbi:uncharacterized protein NEMAJ01_1632 [Nematocida major]|uniref:uncharacterized protein n=1 Tax=Nematocida major TaxID=1912982 RepID=UPI0020072142|nr:uncharacterized protein NEMAJ01_1632 [Nematocida major]KAH9386736.1 hypothetical protein NEMAJ01_1632 [Nematocida major]